MAIGRIDGRVLIATYHHHTSGAAASKVYCVCMIVHRDSRQHKSVLSPLYEFVWRTALTRLLAVHFCGDLIVLVQYLSVAQKVLASDKVLSQQSASVPNAVEDANCLMQTDKKYMYIGLLAMPPPHQPSFSRSQNCHKHVHTRYKTSIPLYVT